MTMMVLRAEAAGYNGLSVGSIGIVTTGISGYIVHRWIGTGASSLIANCITNPFEVPYHAILSNFDGQDVRLKIGGGIAVWGRTNFKFSIRYSAGSRAEVYNVAPSAPDNEIGISVRGVVISDLEIFGNFRLITSGLYRREVIAACFGVMTTT